MTSRREHVNRKMVRGQQRKPSSDRQLVSDPGTKQEEKGVTAGQKSPMSP